jgi:predicted unusual protein kinase regulating ubiquinone biosynthesis (AarF/ABC1/UbiB family)
MEKLDMTVRDWIKTEPSVEEWESFYKQFFVMLDRLHEYHGIRHGDLHPGNLMWRGDCLCIIDFGQAKPFRYGESHYDYGNFVSVYNNKYGINKLSLMLRLDGVGYKTRQVLWRELDSIYKVERIFKDGIVRMEDIDHFTFPDSMVDVVKEFHSLYGQPCSEFIRVFYS